MLACLTWPSAVQGQANSLIAEVTNMAWAGEVDRAISFIESRRNPDAPLTAEWLAAVSWVARGASFQERWDEAARYANEAYGGSLSLLRERPLDAERFLPTALGAAIEVLGHAYDAQGDNAAAVAFLTAARRDYAGTSIEMRIQKNVLLLSLEGKPFPELEVDLHIGAQPPTPEELEGKVVIFFFWAHWCPDCKRQEPVLRELYDEYHDDGLEIVGPTALYGFTARGQPATPLEEFDYIAGPYLEQYPIAPWMSVPIGRNNFTNFGVSTTPTLVIVDRDGIVQRYNPGDLSRRELEALIRPLLG
jgi:thiol-disulfide isomerase/thioredoxin